jgi:coenzyme F420 hydrogenase subunit delta
MLKRYILLINNPGCLSNGAFRWHNTWIGNTGFQNLQLANFAQKAQAAMFEIGSHLTKRCLVFGCGNPLFGDDGFGSRVIEQLLANHTLPDDTACLDVGTAVRDMLFDILLSPQKPAQIVIVDAMDLKDGVPGRIYEINVDQIQPEKICDFSLHQFPTTNMLKEIQEGTDIEVRILVVQTQSLPEKIHEGLSPVVGAAVPEMCARVCSIVQPDNRIQTANSEVMQ